MIHLDEKNNNLNTNCMNRKIKWMAVMVIVMVLVAIIEKLTIGIDISSINKYLIMKIFIAFFVIVGPFSLLSKKRVKDALLCCIGGIVMVFFIYIMCYAAYLVPYVIDLWRLGDVAIVLLTVLSSIYLVAVLAGSVCVYAYLFFYNKKVLR